MDLSNIEGLTPEQIAAITELHDADVSGLKSNMSKIMDEKKELSKIIGSQDDESAAKALADKLQAQKDALNKAEEEKLKLANDMEGLKAHYEKVNAENEAKLKQEATNAQELLKTIHVDKVKNSILSRVTESQKPFVDAMLDKCISTEMKDGAVVTSLSYGDNQFSSADDFINGVSEDKAWQSVLKGANSSGAGSNQSTGNPGNGEGLSPTQLKIQSLKAQGVI